MITYSSEFCSALENKILEEYDSKNNELIDSISFSGALSLTKNSKDRNKLFDFVIKNINTLSVQFLMNMLWADDYYGDNTLSQKCISKIMDDFKKQNYNMLSGIGGYVWNTLLKNNELLIQFKQLILDNLLLMHSINKEIIEHLVTYDSKFCNDVIDTMNGGDFVIVDCLCRTLEYLYNNADIEHKQRLTHLYTKHKSELSNTDNNAVSKWK